MKNILIILLSLLPFVFFAQITDIKEKYKDVKGSAFAWAAFVLIY
jgi:hypothetical protein